MGICAFAAYEAARTTEATNIGFIYGCTSAFVDRRRALAAGGWASASQPACSAWCRS
jgi:hypothetical protein